MNRLKRGLGALVLLALMAGAADAGFRRGGDCAPPPCGPAMQYVTEYRQVQRTVYRCVAETKDVQITEVTFERKETPKSREVTYLVPTMKPTTREYTVYERVFTTAEEKVTVYRPAKKTVEREFWVCKPVTHKETRKLTYYETEYTEKTVEQPVTVWKPVTTMENRQVCTYQTVSVCDPCGHVTCQRVPVTQTVQVPVTRCVPETTVNKYTVQVPSYKERSREVPFEWVENVMTKETRPVEIWVSEAVQETVKVTRCELKPRVVKEEVQVCVLERQTRTENYVEVTFERKETPKTIKVTTYKTVPTVETVTVPVTVCVPVMPCGAPCP
jgi:hypothetical protein